MTIQEAIKSGKPFRRKAYLLESLFVYAQYTETIDGETNAGCWVDVRGLDEPIEIPVLGELRRCDILATDWEVKENP